MDVPGHSESIAKIVFFFVWETGRGFINYDYLFISNNRYFPTSKFPSTFFASYLNYHVSWKNGLAPGTFSRYDLLRF